MRVLRVFRVYVRILFCNTDCLVSVKAVDGRTDGDLLGLFLASCCVLLLCVEFSHVSYGSVFVFVLRFCFCFCLCFSIFVFILLSFASMCFFSFRRPQRRTSSGEAVGSINRTNQKMLVGPRNFILFYFISYNKYVSALINLRALAAGSSLRPLSNTTYIPYTRCS